MAEGVIRRPGFKLIRVLPPTASKEPWQLRLLERPGRSSVIIAIHPEHPPITIDPNDPDV